MVGYVALAAHGEREGGGFKEDGQELGLECGFVGKSGEEGGEELDEGGVEGGEGVVEVGGLGLGVWEEGEDFVGTASLAVEG